MSDDGISYALPRDVYVDSNGKLWRVLGVWRDPEDDSMAAPAPPAKQRRLGGVNGFMWQGFRRIYRDEAVHMTSTTITDSDRERASDAAAEMRERGCDE